MRSASCGVMAAHRLLSRLAMNGEQFFDHRLVANRAVAPEPFHFPMEFITVVHELDFPALAGDVHLDHHRVVTAVTKLVGNFPHVEAVEQGKEGAESVGAHRSYSRFPS